MQHFEVSQPINLKKTEMKTKVEVLDTFFKEVWSNENTAMIKQLFVPDQED